MNVAILDYGAGNMHSLAKAIECSAATTLITGDVQTALESDVLVLPGVGSFASAMQAIAPSRTILRAALADGFPCLGVCLGMQLLFESSEEGNAEGIGFLSGSVRRLQSARVPQIGWNTIDAQMDSSTLFDPLKWVYYANSYVCDPVDRGIVTAFSSYDEEHFPAAIRAGNTIGVQFHPEKSSRAGVDLIGRLLRQVAR